MFVSVYPLNSSGFGGQINLQLNVADGAEWTVAYQNITIEMQNGSYNGILSSLESSPIAISDMSFIPENTFPGNTQVALVTKNAFGDTQTEAVPSVQNTTVNDRFVVDVSLPENSNLTIFSYLQFVLDPNESISVNMTAEQANKYEIATQKQAEQSIDTQTQTPAKQNELVTNKKTPFCKNKLVCFLIIFAIVFAVRELLKSKKNG